MTSIETITSSNEKELTPDQLNHLTYWDLEIAQAVASKLYPESFSNSLIQNLQLAFWENSTEDKVNLDQVTEMLIQRWVIPKIFEWKIQYKLIGTINEWKLNFNGTEYTFVRREWIAESFWWLKNVKECNNWTEATTYLKELFADYADQYPELFVKPDRYKVDSSEMFPIINKWVQDNNIPYAGCQYSTGYHYWAGNKLYVWLPVRVAGKFAFLWSNSDNKKANLYCGNEGNAHLSVSFMN